nr:MAG TPA: hypothetical protein [Caudoviricetes sp.]
MEYLCKNIYNTFTEPGSSCSDINLQVGEIFNYIKDKLNIDELYYRTDIEVKSNISYNAEVIVETKNKTLLQIVFEPGIGGTLKVDGYIHHGIVGSDFTHYINSPIEVGYCIYAIMFAIEEL